MGRLVPRSVEEGRKRMAQSETAMTRQKKIYKFQGLCKAYVVLLLQWGYGDEGYGLILTVLGRLLAAEELQRYSASLTRRLSQGTTASRGKRSSL